MKKGEHYEFASCFSARPAVPLVGLGNRNLRTGNLHDDGVAIAAAHRVDTERWFLAQTAQTAQHEATAVDSDRHRAAAATAPSHLARTGATTDLNFLR